MFTDALAGTDIATVLATDRPHGCRIFMRVIPNINLGVVVAFFPVSHPASFLFSFCFSFFTSAMSRYWLYNCVGPRLTSRSLASVKRD